jgi:phospholipase/lecithinase/hemolysin
MSSLDFAASGAISGREPGYPGFNMHGQHWCCQGMADQVEDFVQRVRNGSINFDPRTTLFFIAGGLNDKELKTETTVSNISHQISLLHSVGACHVSLALLPTRIPIFSKLAQRLNPAYQDLVSSLQHRLHIDLQLNNWGPYFDEVMESPSQYGIVNTTSRCAGRALFNEDETPCNDPETFYFYHAEHPSTAVHRIVGEKLFHDFAGTRDEVAHKCYAQKK